MRVTQGAIPFVANVHKNFLPAFKFTIGTAALTYIVYTIYGLDFAGISSGMNVITFSTQSLILIVMALMLLPANWSLEVLKWRIATSRLERTDIFTSVKAILYGISLGMITPRRTGEFAGRIITLAPRNRISGTLLNMAGSISQLCITLIMGLTGLWMLRYSMSSGFFSVMQLHLIIAAAGISVISLLIFIFSVRSSSIRLNKKNKAARFINSALETLAMLSVRNILALLGLSLIRYIVFISQFYLLLLALGLSIPITVFISLTAVMYLLMALIPLSAIWELGVRGSVAIFVFGWYFGPEVIYQPALLTATSALWLINLAIPALAGTLVAMADKRIAQ